MLILKHRVTQETSSLVLRLCLGQVEVLHLTDAALCCALVCFIFARLYCECEVKVVVISDVLIKCHESSLLLTDQSDLRCRPLDHVGGSV